MTTAQSKRRVLLNNKNPFQLIAQSFIVQKCAVQQYDYQHLSNQQSFYNQKNAVLQTVSLVKAHCKVCQQA